MSSFIDKARTETFADNIKESATPQKGDEIANEVREVSTTSSSKGLMSPQIEAMTRDSELIAAQGKLDSEQAKEETTGYTGTLSIYDNLYKKEKTKTPSVKTSDFGDKMMTRYVNELNLKPFQAAALAGNADYETGGFKFMDELKPTVKGSKGGTNVFQYTGTEPGFRRYNFEKFVKENDLNPREYESGLDFSVFELTEGDQKSVLNKLRKSETAEEANGIVVNSYLKPDKKKTNMPAREALTLKYANNYKKESVRDGL
tara:strand:- start:1696 stop:2472 length:777 start_codon:yes stop_codon:yes gene_type:complete